MKAMNTLIPFMPFDYAQEGVRQAHHERIQHAPFVLDCTDAGVRATHGAVAESPSKDFAKTPKRDR